MFYYKISNMTTSSYIKVSVGDLITCSNNISLTLIVWILLFLCIYLERLISAKYLYWMLLLLIHVWQILSLNRPITRQLEKLKVMI